MKHTGGKASPRVKCEKRDGKTYYLHEIQICVDKTKETTTILIVVNLV